MNRIAATLDLMDENAALRILVGPDETAARKALDLLFAESSPRLERHLTRQYRAQAADREDVVAEVFQKLWRSRAGLEFMDGARWYSFLQTVARNCWLDRVRATRPLQELGEDDQVSAGGDTVASPVLDAAGLQLLKRVADSLWLGLPHGESDNERAQRLLAAQLYFLRGETFDKTLRLALGSASASQPADRRRLEQTLADPATIRLLAHRYLYLAPERVAGAVILPELPLRVEQLNRLMERAMSAQAREQSEQAIGGWTWREVKALLIRFRFARPPRSIASQEWGDYSSEELDDLFVRSNVRLPFESRMARLVASLDRAPAPDAAAALSTAGIWRRLVFEYGHVDEMPHREIVTYLAPAAAMVGYKGISDANVNVLISDRRLLGQLTTACRCALGDMADE